MVTVANNFAIDKIKLKKRIIIIRGILNVNPEKRYGINDLRNHLWWKLYVDDFKLI